MSDIIISSALTYGISHSKEYKPSPVAKFLVEKNKETGRFLKRHSDAFLLLRQNKLQQSIGADVIRGYLDNLRAVHGSSMIPSENLTDDELFSLIEPKSVNNLTTAHEFAQYLKANKDKIVNDHKKLVSEKQARDKWYQFFSSREYDTNKKDD